MNRIDSWLCAIAIVLFSSMASAGSDSGIYIGGSLGSASQSFDLDEGSDNFDQDDSGYKFYAGYNFGIIPLIDLAIEGSYVDFGAPSQNAGDVATELETTAWDLYGLAGINLGPVGLFGKVGTVAWDRNATLNTGDLTVSDSADGQDMAYGVGAKIQIQSFSVRAEYEYFDFEEVDTDMISVGASLTF